MVDTDNGRIFIDLDSFLYKGKAQYPNFQMFKSYTDVQTERIKELLPDSHYVMDNGLLKKFRVSKLANDFALCKHVYTQSALLDLEKHPCGCINCFIAKPKPDLFELTLGNMPTLNYFDDCVIWLTPTLKYLLNNEPRLSRMAFDCCVTWFMNKVAGVASD